MPQDADELLEGDRVRARTAPAVLRRLDAQRAAELSRARGSPALARRRLAELDREWNVDRALMANLALLGGAVFAAGVYRLSRSPRRRWNGWLTFFSVQLGFLLWHSAAGWCPPAPVFRRLGFRTQQEIDAERVSLLHAGGAPG